MIKWIGHHIWDFISRFRNKAYFEDEVIIGANSKITTDGNDNILIDPGGTGSITLKSDTVNIEGAGVYAGGLKLKESDVLQENFISLQAPIGLTSDITLTFPDSDGDSNQVLASNGSGVLSWTDVLTSPNPSATGALVLRPAASTGAVGIQIYNQDGDGDNSDNHYCFIKVPDDLADDYTLTLPPNDGDSGQFLQTDGSGVTSWAAAGGSVSVSDSTANTDFPIVFHDESNNLHDDTGTFTYNPSTGLLTSGKGAITSLRTDDINLGHASDTSIARSAAGRVTIEGEEIVTTRTPALTSAAAGIPCAIMQTRRTITQGEANSMHSTPIEIVPAQGANTVIIPLGGMVRVDRATTQLQSACDWNMHYADQEPGTYLTSSIQHFRRFMYGETGDRVFHITPGLAAYEVAQNLTDDVNKAVEVSFDSAATTNAFTSIDVYLTYQVISIA